MSVEKFLAFALIVAVVSWARGVKHGREQGRQLERDRIEARFSSSVSDEWERSRVDAGGER